MKLLTCLAGRIVSRATSSRSSKPPVFRQLLAQPLESRLLLAGLVGAGHEGEPAAAEVAHVAEGHPSDDGDSGTEYAQEHGFCKDFQLYIEGSSIHFDPQSGLPSQLNGDVYYAGGPHAGSFAGVYQEDITPLIHPDFGLVGADGTGVLTFQNQQGTATLGELTVEYRAMITGLDASGALQIQSKGTIVGGTRMLADAEGSITTSSSLLMGPQFAMHVNVDLHACRSLPSTPQDAKAVDLAFTENWHPEMPLAAPPSFLSGIHDNTASGAAGMPADSGLPTPLQRMNEVALAEDAHDAPQVAPHGTASRPLSNSYAADVDNLLNGLSNADWLDPHALPTSWA